eukprot:CAMPEP_0173107192 /NCGR_PEP_ID=MMETSP1102-20130122/41607_1 /TAXON_ID=49646 /ORGANISM="Geminigera sp., Strain Caron Lab Isolate" /LENGTH=196 /DNA_ID=CAMNT_0014004687 /DNA_START=118 /DNA_END=708 /DNA_ORIENTATION=-
MSILSSHSNTDTAKKVLRTSMIRSQSVLGDAVADARLDYAPSSRRPQPTARGQKVTARSMSVDRTAKASWDVSETSLWRTVYEDLGRWGANTAHGVRPKVVTKSQVENKAVDINRPVYPSSPKPSRGGKHWRSDNRNLGNWGPETFRKWIPKQVDKTVAEAGDDTAVTLTLPKPHMTLFDALKSSSLCGPQQNLFE